MHALVSVLIPKRLDSTDLLNQPLAPVPCGFGSSCCGFCMFLIVDLEEPFVVERVNAIFAAFFSQDP